MELSKGLGCVFVAGCVALAGCATPQKVYGERARYSPAFAGYVMAANDGSDDPGKDDTVLLLRDPVSGKKLRCREEVEEWRELHEDLAIDRMHDHRATIATIVTVSAVFAPLAAMQPLGSLVTLEAFESAGGMYNLLRTKDGPELLSAGIKLFERERYPQSSLLIEHALGKDEGLGVQSKAFYYLGLSYAEQGKRARAGLALSSFLDRAAVRDVDGYRKAESRLKSLGFSRKACASTEPVELRW